MVSLFPHLPLYNSFCTKQPGWLLKKYKSDHVISWHKTFQWLPVTLRIISILLLPWPSGSFMIWPLPTSLTTFPLIHSPPAILAFFLLSNMLSFPFFTLYMSCLSLLLRMLFPQTCPWLVSAQCHSLGEGSPHHPQFALFSLTER